MIMAESNIIVKIKNLWGFYFLIVVNKLHISVMNRFVIWLNPPIYSIDCGKGDKTIKRLRDVFKDSIQNHWAIKVPDHDS